MPHPGDDLDALGVQNLFQLLADWRVLPAVGLLVAGDGRRHEREIHFRHLATAVGERQHAHVERALAQRRELGRGLDQRAAREYLELEITLAALLDLGGKLARQPVAEIAALVARRRELVRDLDHGLGTGGGAGQQCAHAEHEAQTLKQRFQIDHGRDLLTNGG
jgi:hypothetical protein